MVYYFAQNASIEAKKADGTYEVVGAVQEVSFEWNIETQELYEYGNIRRCDVARHNESVTVNCNFAKFANPTDKNEWFWSMFNGVGWQDYCNMKRVNVLNTSTTPLFKICGEFRPTDGSADAIYVECLDIYFKKFNWGGSMGEYIIENLEGTGTTLNFYNHAPNDWIANGVNIGIYSPTGRITLTIGDVQDITLSNNGTQITGCAHTYLCASSSPTICSIDVDDRTGIFTATGVSSGVANIFCAVDGNIITIPITVTT